MADTGSTTRDRTGAVKIAYVCGNQVVYSWHRSLIDLLTYDSRHNERVMRGGFVGIRYGADGLSEARNTAVRTFLDEDDADWLFWIDTDMGFPPDTIDRLMDAADPVERPIVGGLCFFNREDASDGMGGYRTTVVPTVYDWVHVEDQYGWAVRWNLPVNTVTQVGGTGAACILIHRSVFERIEKGSGQVWYDRVANRSTGTLVGEDLSFCLRAGSLKIPIFVHTGVATTHFKPMWVSEEHYWKQVALDGAREAAQQLAADRSDPAVDTTPEPAEVAP